MKRDEAAKLQPDYRQIRTFAACLFKYADPSGYVSLRAFYDDQQRPFYIVALPLADGLDLIIDTAMGIAIKAANAKRPVVFAPPIATFSNGEHARERDLLQGLALSTECDQHPSEARAKLEALLGPATIVVRSGGRWTNGSDAAEDKLHVHHRLARPATGAEDLAKLKQARALAASIVGADPSGKPAVHPFRWPGSVHRKAEPRLCEIVELNDAREIDLDAALQVLIAAAPPSATAKGEASGKKAKPAGKRDYDDLIMNGAEQGERSELFQACVWHLACKGLTIEQIEEELAKHPNGIRAKYEERLRGEVQRSYEKWQAERAGADQNVAEINKSYALVIIGDKTMVMKESAGISLLQPSAFRQWFANRYVAVGSRNMPLAKYWLEHSQRRQYESIVFAPGDRQAPPQHYNLWHGFAVEPRPGDCSKFLAHVLDNVCCGSKRRFNWVMGWFAQIFQQPDEKVGTSLALRGRQGVGKSKVGEVIGSLLGAHYVPVAEPRYITGRFNAHLNSCLLLHADEAFWAGDKTAEGKLKDLVTGLKHPIEYKGKEVIWVANYIRLFVTGNQDWQVPAGFEERRFGVLDVGEGHMQDKPYFAAIDEEMDNGGREALLYYLLHFDLSTVDLRSIPKTDALLDQKIASLTPEQGWWLDILQRGQLPDASKRHGADACPKDALFDSYIRHAEKQGVRRRAIETALGISLRKLVPYIHVSKLRVGLLRSGLYTFPPLAECREQFSDLLQQRVKWEGPEKWELAVVVSLKTKT